MCSTSIKYLQTNRMIHRYNNFLILNFSRKAEALVVREALKGGIVINSEEYHFIGCSSGGLKTRTCYMYKGSKVDVDRIWAECGMFTSIKSRYKRLKRIGLLFSSAIPTGIEIEASKVVQVPDIEESDHNFTDGCGGVSRELALQLRRHCAECNDNYLPSVYQIRYQGCKGVVALDVGLKGIQLALRPSMRKFSSGTLPFNELWLCDHSHPYSFGHLNRQFITLLSSLGVKDQVLLEVQEQHFQRLERVTTSIEAAIEMILLDNQADLLPYTANVDFLSKFNSQLIRLRAKALSKLEKLRVPIMKSRNIFGVCDLTGKLQYGQCYLQFTEHGQSTTLQGRVIVAKNPCYLLGDVRVLNAVDVDGLDHLVDCIVFPTQGKRPHPSEIAGSDLDGDQYFVCWEKGLIIPRVYEPYDYPSNDRPETNSDLNHDVLIDFFASQRHNMGKIDSYYKYWASKKGAGCSECRTLGKLFSRSVDATKTGDRVIISPNLVPPSEVEELREDSAAVTNSCFVWEEMKRRAIEKKKQLCQDVLGQSEVDITALTEDFLWSLLEFEMRNKMPNVIEFQLLKLLYRWCYSQQSLSKVEADQKFLDFAQYINFGELTVDQQVDAIDCGIPLSTVMNAFNHSCLPKDLVRKFSLDDPHRNWRFYYRADSAHFKWKYLLRCICTHPQSMLVIHLADKVYFAIHFLSEVAYGESTLGDSAVAYFSSSHFNLHLQHSMGLDFKITLDKDKLQIYQRAIQSTFIWLRREVEEKQAKGRSRKQNVDSLFDRISVDLTRFKRNILRGDHENHPKVNKQSLVGVEMYVKTRAFEPAYLDYTEADIPSDYPVDEVSFTEEIEELPTELAENNSLVFADILPPDCHSTALTLIEQCAKHGNVQGFYKCLAVLQSKDDPEISAKLLASLTDLLSNMFMMCCHTNLSEQALVEDCLYSILSSLQSALTPTCLLELISQLAQLRLIKLIQWLVDEVSPTITATSVREYADIISSWEYWFHIPFEIAAKLAEYFHSLYSSLCYTTPGQNVSIDLGAVMELANDLTYKTSLEQHEADRYSAHVLNLLHAQFMLEIHSLKDQQNKCCDTTSSIVIMHCYDYKHPHSIPSSSEGKDNEGTKGSSRIGFNRLGKGISSKNFTLGSFVSINLMTKSNSKFVAFGHITRAERNPADIVVELVNSVPLCLQICMEKSVGHWKLGLVGNVTLFKRSLKALKSLHESPSALLSLVVKSHPKVSCINDTVKEGKSFKGTSMAPSFSCEILNRNQQRALSCALSQRLTLIHGPPGTGKTHVACEIVSQQLARNCDHPILVVAETNMAVDNLCEKLLSRNIRVVRIGNLEQISPLIHGISLDGQIEKKRIQEGKDKQGSRLLSKTVSRPILKAAQVVATTCSSSGDPSLKGLKFPVVIVDEATQVTEPTSLIPLMYGCQQLTLIGDPEQLTPSVPMNMKSDQAGELSVTLFHRLQKLLPSTSVFLNEQHRMHPKLVEFPSARFYDGRLLTAKSRLEEHFHQEINFIDNTQPCVFINCEGLEKYLGTSFCNAHEAEMVTGVIKHLLTCQISTQQIAVLTPYTGQSKCIQEKCQREKLAHVRLHTIDSFQGREADVVIFSTVHCNPSYGLGFVDDKYRVNVLLTRARHFLIGIGSHSTLSSSCQLWNDWLRGVTVMQWSDECLQGRPKASCRDPKPAGGQQEFMAEPEVVGARQPRIESSLATATSKDARPISCSHSQRGQRSERRDRRRGRARGSTWSAPHNRAYREHGTSHHQAYSRGRGAVHPGAYRGQWQRRNRGSRNHIYAEELDVVDRYGPGVNDQGSTDRQQMKSNAHA